jgi:aryl-alcohol dehydrogenase-like predicted oxidoreductase
MSYADKVTLGKTGLLVSRIGIGCSYGVDTASQEEAFERGINYFYFGTFRRPAMAKAIHHLAPKHRDQLVITIQSYSRWAPILEKSVHIALKKLKIDYADLLLFGMMNKPPSKQLVDRAMQLKQSGKVKFLAISAHHRAAFAEYIRGGIFDAIMARYNAAHTGAEKEVFPLLPLENRPGVICYTATRWGTLLKGIPGEQTPTASDCYRFVLNHPDVNICLTGPKNRAEMQEALRVFSLPPMSAEEMEWMRRVGKAVYQRKDRTVVQTLLE